MVLLEDGDERVGLCPLNGTKDKVRINWDNYTVHTTKQNKTKKNNRTISATHFPHSPFAAIHCDYLSLFDAAAVETMTLLCLAERMIKRLCVLLKVVH